MPANRSQGVRKGPLLPIFCPACYFSQRPEMRVGNMVDPNYSVVVKMPKRLLPQKQ
jgi:hypothetical protein